MSVIAPLAAILALAALQLAGVLCVVGIVDRIRGKTMRKAEIIAAVGHAAIEATEARPMGSDGVWSAPGFEWWNAFCAALDKGLARAPGPMTVEDLRRWCEASGIAHFLRTEEELIEQRRKYGDISRGEFKERQQALTRRYMAQGPAAVLRAEMDANEARGREVLGQIKIAGDA